MVLYVLYVFVSNSAYGLLTMDHGLPQSDSGHGPSTIDHGL